MRPASARAETARTPRLAPGCDPARLTLSPAEGYLLSRVDGATPWAVLREIGGLSPEDVDRCLERWRREGLIVLDAAARPQAGRPGAAASATGASAPAPQDRDALLDP